MIDKNNNNFRRNKSLKNEKFRNDIYKNLEINDNLSNSYLSTSSFGDEKDNHCLKFDSYSPRKPLINNRMYITDLRHNNIKKNNDNISRNFKGVIDYNRVSNSNYGSYFDEITRNQNNPPLGMYRPNYDFNAKKPRNIFLDNKVPISPKFAKLKKILCKFDVSISKLLIGLIMYFLLLLLYV